MMTLSHTPEPISQWLIPPHQLEWCGCQKLGGCEHLSESFPSKQVAIINTPSDSQCKQGLDKMRCNSGLSNSFFRTFFFIGSIAPARKAQNPNPKVSFSSHIKKVRSTPAQVARLYHPNFGASVKRVPICWGDMSGAEGASVGQKRKNFNLSEREELVRHLLAGSEDGVLKHGARGNLKANQGMIAHHPPLWNDFFFSCLQCDI